MRSIVILLIIYGVLGISPILQPYKSEAQDNLKQLLKQKQPNFENLYNELYIIKETSGKLDTDETCSYLRNLESSNLPQRDAYFYLMSLKQVGCDYNDIDFPLPSKSVPDDLTEYYFNGLLALERNKNAFCDKIDTFLGKEGAAKIKKSKSDDNYEKASQLYHLAAECINHETNPTLQKSILEVIRLPIQTALINLQEVFVNTRAFVERENSIISTSRLISVFIELLPRLGELNPVAKKDFEDSLIQKSLINLLRDNLRDTQLSSSDRYWTLRSLKNDYLKDLIIPIISNQINFPSKTVQIQVKFTNIFGDKVSPPTSIVGKLFRQGNKLQQNITFQSGASQGKEYAGYFELSKESVNKLGQYELDLQVSNGKLNYLFSTSVQIGTKYKIEEFNFAIVQGKNAKPDFDHQVEDKDLYPRTLDANELSFLHVIFKVVFEKGLSIVPQQVAIRLAHPLYPTASFFVPAQYDSRRDVFYGLVDFGDPEHILPINGLYAVELLIGDVRIVENKRWKFAQIEVNFGISLKNGPLSETDNVIPELIVHQFNPPTPEIPFIFVSFFLGVIVIAFIFFLGVLKALGVNTERIPNDSSQVLVYAFFGIIVAIFVVLFLFWVVFNLIETLTILSVALVPLFLVGNFALLSLK